MCRIVCYQKVFLLALFLALPSSTRATTHLVTNLQDSGPGSLRQSIADAAPGDTITFGVTGTITLTSGPLRITQDLAIEGPGPKQLKISGNQADRVFFIWSGRVILAGLTITDGLADDHVSAPASIGGGVLNYADLTLSNAVVSANTALGEPYAIFGDAFGLPGSGLAGGIANFVNLNVIACSFTGNLARGGDNTSGLGGEGGLGFGGAIVNWGIASITDSQFTGNLARGGDNGKGIENGKGLGGALGNAFILTITNSGFDHNQAIGGDNCLDSSQGIGGGGAICSGFIGQPWSMLGVNGCRIERNLALGGNGGPFSNGRGGGILIERHGEAAISNCTIIHNEARGGNETRGDFGGIGTGGGLAVIIDDDQLIVTVSNSTVQHNSARGGTGGVGFYSDAGLGGGIAKWMNYGTLTLNNTAVENNHAWGGSGGNGDKGQGIGGGVYYVGTFSFDSKTSIEKNHASTSEDNIGHW